MGKGTRNRIDRAETVKEPKKVASKPKKTGKPMSKNAKVVIACVLAFLLVAGVVAGVMAGNGVFRSRTPLVITESGEGTYTLTKAGATYLLWETQINYVLNLYSSWGYLTSSNAQSIYASLLTNYRSEYTDNASLRSILEDGEENLTGYVAVCDVAESLGISLTKEEIKTAKQNANASLETWMNIANNLALSNLSSGTKSSSSSSSSEPYTQKDYNKDVCSSTKDFLKKYVNSCVTKQDVESVAVISALYTKVLNTKNDEVESALIKNGVMDEEKLTAYRDENKADFYTTKYISYVADNTELRDKLTSATDIKEFKKIIAETVADSVYSELFNKYATDNGIEAETLRLLVSGSFNKNLELLGMTYSATQVDITALPTDVQTWLSDADREAKDVTVIADGDDSYTVVFLASGTTTQIDGETSKDVPTYTFAYKKDTAENAETLKTLLGNIKNQSLTAEELLTPAIGLKQYSGIKADALEVPADIKTWLTDSSREAYDIETVTVDGEGLYLVLYISKDASGETTTYTYAIRKYELVEATDSYKDSATFKTDIVNSVLIDLGLSEGEAVYTSASKAEDGATDETVARYTAAVSIFTDMKSEIDTALTESSETYVKYTDDDLSEENKDKDLLKKWLFGINSEDESKTTSPADIGATYVEEKTEDEKTSYTVYGVTESMILDDDNAIWGGYITFSGDDREASANEAVEKLNGLTGIELWNALQDLGATVDYGFESSDLSSKTKLYDWMFSDERKAGDIGTITATETSTSSSTTTTTDVIYVAVVMEKTQCWKATAMSSSINATLEDWIEECRTGYTLNADILNKMPEEVTTAGETTTETATEAETPAAE